MSATPPPPSDPTNVVPFQPGPLSGGRDNAPTEGLAGYVPPASVPAELANHERYKIVHLLGRGGMGSVFLAEDKVLGRMVALKVLAREATSRPDMVQRFQREIRAVARLDHPNIVRAHDAGQAGDVHFLVMAYVEGKNLAQVVAERGPLPVGEACAYVRQAAEGLGHAFDRGLVHRDLKPSNLMRTSRGQIKILDFGLAVIAQESDALSRTKVVLGTPDFMAPEQASAPQTADVRADVYSLGCTLFYLLTGKPPFEGGAALAKVMRHQSEPPPPLDRYRTDVPPEVAAALAKMLAKDPGNRFAQPADVAAALAPFGAAEPPATEDTDELTRPGGQKPAKAPRPVKPPAPPRPLVAGGPLMALGFTALLMLTLTLVGAVSYYHQNSGVLVFFLHDPALTAGSLQIKRDGQVITHVDLARDHEIRLQAGSLQLEAANPDVPLAIYDGTQQGAGEGGTCAFQLRPGETRTINVHPIRTKKP